MLCTVKKPFPYASDGMTTKSLEKGQTIDFPETLVPGLKAAGLISGGASTAPENKAIASAPETGNTQPPTDERAQIDIPEDWAELKWPEMLSLAASLSDEPVKDKDAATDAITAELARRGTPAASE